MTVIDESQVTPCVEFSNIYLHPLLDESQTVSTQANRREQAMLRNQAEKMCSECPIRAQCLTNAVTKFDVSGFVAGTTKRQRQEIRGRLGINLDDDDFDAYAGVNSGRQFDRAEIHRLRMANPTEPLSAIAARVGCSVSTVKRHLRRIEREGLPDRSSDSRAITPEEVVAVADEVVRGTRRSAAA